MSESSRISFEPDSAPENIFQEADVKAGRCVEAGPAGANCRESEAPENGELFRDSLKTEEALPTIPPEPVSSAPATMETAAPVAVEAAVPVAVEAAAPVVVEPAPTVLVEQEADTPPVVYTARPRRSHKGLLIFLAAVLACLLLAAGFHRSRYTRAVELAGAGEFLQAQETLFLPQIVDLYDSDFQSYLQAGIALTSEQWEHARDLLDPLVRRGYRDSAGLQQSASYHFACQLLEEGDWDSARSILNTLDGSGYPGAADMLLTLDYQEGCAALDSRDWERAQDLFSGLASAGYRDSYTLYNEARIGQARDLIKGCQSLEDVSLGLRILADVIRDGCSDGEVALVWAQDQIFTAAKRWYDDGNFTRAEYLFNLLPDNSDAEKYAILCRVSTGDASLSELKSVWGFGNSKELIYDHGYLYDFLVGKWYSSNRSYYFTMTYNGNGYYQCTYNIPWKYEGTFQLSDGIMLIFENSTSLGKSQFRFSVRSWDEISVYSYKDEKSYTLRRQ